MIDHIMTVATTARGTDPVLAHTLSLAKSCRSKVTLLRLLNPITDKSRSTRIVDPLDWHIRKLEIEAALNQVAENLRQADIEVTTAVLEGADAELLVQYAEANGVDLMLLSKQPENIGDLIHPVMKRTTLPVMVLPTDELWFGADTPDRYQKILVPLDGSQRAEVIVSISATLAKHVQPQFVLVHVVRRPEIPRHAPPNAEETELVERLIEINRADAARYLEQFAARLPGPVQTRLLVSDNVAASLHELVAQEAIDLIVMSAHGYSGEPRWPYGSVTANVITYSAKPVLVVQDLPAVTPLAGSGALPAMRMFRKR